MDGKYDILIENFRQLVPISDQEAEIIKGAFVAKQLNKKELLLSKGDLSNHMRFVADGCLKVYSIGEKDMEHILQFGISGWWINDLYAYLTETTSELFIQAITPSTVLQIHRDRLNKLYDEIPMVDRFFRIKTQHGYVALQNRTIRTMSQTAEERYVKFISDYREMEQKIPQYMIAAFIGVTPEHLSAIRKKMSL
ncbi:Crp/Fnr family transcriptional regulator [Fulvivirga sp.]|uniref:Crp/Fnr family transcriptional regulator n=1 Tax=Fulvivirga sp. TaxID=1931237 RepID=UPI0032EEC9E7